MKKNHQKTIKIRFFILFCCMAIAFIILIGKLTRLQAYETDKFKKLAAAQQVGCMEIRALRGSVYDRNGSILAFSVDRPSIAINPRQVKNPDRTAFYLSLALGKKKKELLPAFKGNSTFNWIARKVDDKTAQQIEKLKLEGVFVINESTGKRYHPKRRIASHVVGYTGIDDQGLEGVEASYDEVLSGKSGVLEAEMDQRGRILPGGDFTYKPPVPGKDLYLTIDESIQYQVEKELEHTVKKFHAEGGTIIVYDPIKGDVLALASYPDYLPSRGIWAPKSVVRNRAVCDNYEPGSTFKSITASAALDSGKATTKDQFYCGSSLEVGGYSLRNANDGISSPTGSETIEGVITYSFNVGSAEMGLKIGKHTLYEYVDKMGFGKLTGIDLPGETEGLLMPGKYWKPINLATISYGQGIAVTPIQMVQAYGAIANEGVMMRPRLVRKIIDNESHKVKVLEPKVVGKPLKPKTAHEMLKILKNVCENGTGKAAKIEGFSVGGKTGTANVVENGAYISGKYIASFVGITPIEDPRLVVLIKIDEPKGIIWGGCVAAPAFKTVATEALWKLGIRSTDISKAGDITSAESQKQQED